MKLSGSWTADVEIESYEDDKCMAFEGMEIYAVTS